SAQIREILISESAWEEMTCLFAPSLVEYVRLNYESLMELLDETVKKVAEEPSFIGSYPFKTFKFW
ncbi:hypothetical protein P2Q59_21975, partial [Escherichia coli]